MWDLGNRGFIALVSALSGCVFLYNVWGPILILTILLFLTIYACYSLIVNDSLLSRHAFLLLDYCKRVSYEVRASFEFIVDYIYQYIRQFLETANYRFRKQYLTQTQHRMERRHTPHYQLSNDPYSIRRNSSNFGSIAQLSPIPKNSNANMSNDISSKNNIYHSSGYSLYEHNSPATKHTSTGMFPPSKEELENQTFTLSPSNRTLPKRTSSMYRQNQATSEEENIMYFDAESSSWGSSTSSRTETKTGERKAVQTVAGSPLSSTRYNIDPKIYTDVTSPGLTARLTKYAAEANNKLIHQSQYRVGQFPKVNLHASPVPLINVKSVKPRTQVTVRVAPPRPIQYSSPMKQNILSNSCNSDNSYSLPSVAQTLREISLKRHASRDDVTSELAKKQRTDVLGKEFEIQDEMKQKRSREESLKSEEDISPQSTAVRPIKRTKTPSCYDIINSLSSSKHVVSGVKRKARDFSRSGTPDFEKHFKSLECVQCASTQTLPLVTNTIPRRHNYQLTERGNILDACKCINKLQDHSPLRGILKTSNTSPESGLSCNLVHEKHLNTQSSKKEQSKELIASTESARLTHKLFMRAEPERNEKLRMLVEEQGNIRAKFTTDDVEEIKKEDIADMRQTSMKARLQSMFDAISGKAASRINPDVVIQAEEVNTGESVACPVPCATLNSSTTTTNMNTTPISTSAVAPSPGANELVKKSVKHVAFNLPNAEASSNTNVQFANTSERRKVESVSTVGTDKMTSVTSGVTFSTTKSGIVSEPTISKTCSISSMNSSAQNCVFGKSVTSTSVTSSLSTRTTFTDNAISASNNPPLLVTPTTTNIFGNIAIVTPTTSITSTSTTTQDTRNKSSESNPRTDVSQTARVNTPSSNIATENVNMTSTQLRTSPAAVNGVTVEKRKDRNVGSTSINNVNLTPFTGVAINSTSSSSTITTANTSTSLFTFGSKTNDSSTTSKSEGLSFSPAGNMSQGGGTFGSSTKTRQDSTVNNVATSTSTSCVVDTNSTTNVATSTGFDSNTKINPFTLGSSTSSTFTFRSMSASDNKPGFSFNNTSPMTSVTTGTSNATLFSTGSNNSTPIFASSSSSSTTTKFVSSTSSIFTNTSPSTSSIFGAATTNNQPIFGTSTLNATTATFTLPKSIATPVFGSSITATSTGFTPTNSMPTFSNSSGGGSSSGITSTASMPVFGSNANIPASVVGNSDSNSVGGNLFSSANPTISTYTFPTTNNIFGQLHASNATNFKSNSGVFGSNNGSTLFGSQATMSPTFGISNVSSNSTTASTFGSTNVSSSNTSVPVFGGTTTVTSAFGSQNQNKGNPGSQDSSGSQNFNVGSSIFGGENTTVPVFGTSNSSASLFNPSATNNTFTRPNATVSSSSTFGAATTGNPNGPAAFGDSNKVSPFGTQSSAFGAPNVSSPSFGNANAKNENNTTGGIFTFGANQKSPQQNTASFSFGGNNNIGNNAPASTSTPFQFGATTSNAASGFNFSAPSTTPSINFGTSSMTTFNAATPGMFSIGSGSTAPRSRNIRTRKMR